MKYHLTLNKGMSYHGYGVSATKKNPDVTVDAATMQKLVAAGYFKLANVVLEEGDVTETNEESPESPDESTSDEETPAELFEESGEADQEEVAEITQEELTVSQEDLSKMTKAQLTDYAEEHQISLDGCTTKAAMLKAISVAIGGSETMIDMQED